jgi:hypothetical protein
MPWASAGLDAVPSISDGGVRISSLPIAAMATGRLEFAGLESRGIRAIGFDDVVDCAKDKLEKKMSSNKIRRTPYSAHGKMRTTLTAEPSKTPAATRECPEPQAEKHDRRGWC